MHIHVFVSRPIPCSQPPPSCWQASVVELHHALCVLMHTSVLSCTHLHFHSLCEIMIMFKVSRIKLTLMIAFIYQFSALEQSHCAHVACGSKWMTILWHHLSIRWKGVLTALFGCYMAYATWNCCHIGTCSVHTVQPCTSLQCNFIWSHMHMCICVSL